MDPVMPKEGEEWERNGKTYVWTSNTDGTCTTSEWVLKPELKMYYEINYENYCGWNNTPMPPDFPTGGWTIYDVNGNIISGNNIAEESKS